MVNIFPGEYELVSMIARHRVIRVESARVFDDGQVRERAVGPLAITGGRAVRKIKDLATRRSYTPLGLEYVGI